MNQAIETYIPESIKVLISEAVQNAKVLKITTAEECNLANQYIIHIKDLRKQIEAKRVEITKPLNDGLRKINAFFKTALQPLDEADRILADKILAFKKAEEERIAKQQKELEKQVKKEEKKLSKELGQRIVLPTPQVQSTLEVSTRKVRRWRVLDENKIPDEYWVLDTEKINKAVNAGLVIPGLEIYETEVLIRR